MNFAQSPELTASLSTGLSSFSTALSVPSPLATPLLLQTASQGASSASSIAFIDANVPDYQSLLAGVAPGTDVYLLNDSQDAVTQITNTLLGRHNISSLHIVSHGEAGGLDFGSNALNLADLPQYAVQLQTWGQALTSGADVMLYGCNVAAGDRGQAFIQAISQLTGADVAASNNLTGKDGDWNLEVSTGKIESSLVFDSQVTTHYAHDLNILGDTFTGSDVNNPYWIYNTTGTQPYLTARSTVAASPGGLPGGGTDSVGSGALRLTSAANNQASFVIYNRPINASSGFSITFAIHAYGGNGADGISFFLIDGNANPTQAGAPGGSLGYSSSTAGSGLVGGYLGVGFDEFGNFSNPQYGAGGPGQTPESIAVHGSQANSYKYLAGTGTLSPTIDDKTGSRASSTRTVEIDLTPGGLLSVKIDLNNDGVFSGSNEIPTALQNYDVVASNGALPSTFKFGFSASTGGSTNIHEITGLDVSTYNNAPYVPLVNFTSSTASVSEGASSLNLTAQIDTITSNTVTVPVTLSGTAANGTDYTLSNNVITIQPGQLTGSITLNPIDNAVVGSSKNVVVTMGTPTGAQLSPQNNTLTATILENDYTLNVTGTPTYVENASPVVISPTVTIANELSAATITTATVAITGGFSSAEDRLGIQGQNGTSGTIAGTNITWNYDTTNGILTLSGTDTGANYQAALQKVVYSDTSNAPSTATRTITYALTNDVSQQFTSGGSPTIAVNAVNDAPSFTGNATLASVTQNTPNPTGSTIASLFGSLFSDPDAGASLSGLAIVGNTADSNTQGQWQYSLDGTTWINVGTVADGATALALSAATQLRFVPVSGYNGTPAGLTVRALDDTYAGGFTNGTTRVTVDTTTKGGTAAIAVSTNTLNTSVTPIVPTLVWRNSSTGKNAVWQLNNFALQTGYYIPTINDPNWQIVSATADFNKDGSPDLLWRNKATGENAIWLMNSTGFQSGSFFLSADTNWDIVGTGDFNKDGSPDIVWRNRATGENAIWQMNGVTLQSGSYFQTIADANWQIVGITDFNKDGTPDLLWRNKATGQNAIWQMNGVTLQTASYIQSTDTNWDIVGTGDFNKDGSPDIVWRNRVTGQNAIWQMNGVTLQTGYYLDPLADTNWRVLGVADLGGDSTPEILWQNTATAKVMIWQQTGVTQTQSYQLIDEDATWSGKPFVLA